MPIPATAIWPKPKGEDEFEDITVDFLRIRWQDPHVTRNGRRGQRQDGIDIIGHPSWLKGKLAGAQCKNTPCLKLPTIIAEVAKAQKFKGGLGEFLLVTTADRDAALQCEVREYFKAHPAPFQVDLVFWPDVVADISSDEQLVAKYWKGFSINLSSTPELTYPAWIDRAGVMDNETTECQCEITLSIPPHGTDLDASEVAAGLTDTVRKGSGGRLFRTLLRQRQEHANHVLKWAYRLREYGNVILKWELEIANHGLLIYRWSEFTTGNVPLFRIADLIDGTLIPISLHRIAIGRIVQQFGSREPASLLVRIAARGSGPMLLHDNTGIMGFMLAAPESQADWSVQLESTWPFSPIEFTTRLINRVLSNFNPREQARTLLRVEPEVLSKFLLQRSIENNLAT